MFPSNLDRTETIEVDDGHVVGIQFKELNLCDGESFLTIRDGDGTTLMELESFDLQESLPGNISSISNRVHVSFKTRDVRLGYRCEWEKEDHRIYNVGWSLSWSTMTPGAIYNIYFTLS